MVRLPLFLKASVSGFVFNSVSFCLVHKITTGNRVGPNHGALFVLVRFIWFGVNAAQINKWTLVCLLGPLVNSGVNTIHTNHRKWGIYVSFPVLVSGGELRDYFSYQNEWLGTVMMNLLHTKASDCWA